MYEKLVTKVNNIDTCGSVLKTKYDNGKSDLERKISEAHKKIPDTSGHVKKTDYNSTIKIECKMLSISGLATNSALTAVENKTPVISLVKKSDYEIKISEVEKKVSDHNQDKYITIPEFNNLAAEVFTARLAQVTKTDFDNRLGP